MKNTNVKNLTLAALLIALTYVATAVIKIPIPFNGYVNLGFCMLLLSSYFFGTRNGILAGSIGSALADLLSPYAIWTIPTFVIKVLIGLTVGSLFHKKEAPKKLNSILTAAAVVAGSLIHVGGYTLATGVLEGNLYAALASAPLLGLECIANAAAFYALAAVLRKARIQQ